MRYGNSKESQESHKNKSTLKFNAAVGIYSALQVNMIE